MLCEKLIMPLKALRKHFSALLCLYLVRVPKPIWYGPLVDIGVSRSYSLRRYLLLLWVILEIQANFKVYINVLICVVLLSCRYLWYSREHKVLQKLDFPWSQRKPCFEVSQKCYCVSAIFYRLSCGFWSVADFISSHENQMKQRCESQV